MASKANARLAESISRNYTTTFNVGGNEFDSGNFYLNIVSGTGSPTAATATITLASVLAGDTVTINGLVYTAVTGAKSDNTEFSIDGNDTVDGADLVDSIDNDVRTGIADFTAGETTGVVTITAEILIQSPVDGNSITLVSSNGTRLAVTGSGTLAGGVDGDSITLTFDAYDPASKTWVNILTSAALSTDAATQYHIGRYVATAANVAIKNFLPKVFRVIATKANGSPIVYSIGANYSD